MPDGREPTPWPACPRPISISPTWTAWFSSTGRWAEAAERPVLAYNIPGRIPLNLDTRTFERLIRIPGVAGLKDSSGNLSQITLTAAIDEGRIIVFNGEDQVLWYGLMAGCVGGIGSTYPVMLKVFVDLYRAFLDRDWDRGLELQRGINRTVRGC